MFAKLGSLFSRRQTGSSLLETLIATGILGVIGAIFLSGLATSSQSTGIYSQRATAANLAQSQLEILKAAPYDDTPPYYDNVPSVTLPPGYNIYVSTVPAAEDEQEIKVRVTQSGETVIELIAVKADW